jgi:Phosphotransferase system, HPr-related proteins
MKKVTIKLQSIQDVRDFVNLMTTQTIDIDLSSGRYVVDGKSIMGIFSLDLLSPIEMTVHSDDCTDLLEAVKKYEVK